MIDTIVCRDCGCAVVRKSSRGRKPTRCEPCKKAFHIALVVKHPLACPVCGREFLGQKHQTYCSRECYNAARQDLAHRDCPTCGKRFTVRTNSRQRFCSVQCSAAQLRLAVKPCKQCGREFRPKRSRHADFCSKQCASLDRWAVQAAQSAALLRAKADGRLVARVERAIREECKQLSRHCPDCGERLSKFQQRCDPCRDARELARRVSRPVRSKSNGARLTVAEKWRIYKRDDYKCHICGEGVDKHADPNDDWFPSIDHVVPKSQGGTDAPENLRCAHRICNAIRFTHPLDALPDAVVLRILKAVDRRMVVA